MICVECAKKHNVLKSYKDSYLCSLALEEEPGCELCGKKTDLSETFIPYETCKRIQDERRKSKK
jgi:hypothetical protein